MEVGAKAAESQQPRRGAKKCSILAAGIVFPSNPDGRPHFHY